MNVWKEGTLDGLCKLRRGHDLPSNARRDGVIPIYSSSGISGYHDHAKCSGPGVITGRYGTIGNVFYSDIDYWPLNTTLYVEDFHGNHEKFVYYFLKTLEWEKFNDKSAVPGINRNDVHKEIIKYPEIDEQRAIAAVLSSLDDKIDLLHRQNATLEAMAEALFRQWFVVEAKEKWEEFTINDIAYQIKKSISPQNHPQEIFYHYSIPAYDLNKNPEIEYGNTILSNKFIVEENCILISKLNPQSPRVWYIMEEIQHNSISSTEFISVKPYNHQELLFIYCLFKNHDVSSELARLASGTSGSHQRIKPEDIFSVTFYTPSRQYLTEFSNQVLPMYRRIRMNHTQINTLEKLRDTLLPKLMSGEIRVNF